MKRGIPEESFLIFDKDGDIKKDSSGIPNLVKHNRGLPLRAAPQGGFALAPTHGYSDIRFLRNRRRTGVCSFGIVGEIAMKPFRIVRETGVGSFGIVR